MSESLFGKDYSEDVSINRFKLEQESEKQPSLFYYYADLLATAKADRDSLEERLDFTNAAYEMDLRTAPGRYLGEVKVTEGTIKAAVDSNPKAQAIRLEYLDKSKEIYHLEAAVKSLEHRKSELDNLVQLWIKGYYAAPDGGKPSATDDVQNQMRKNLNKSKESSDEK